MYSLMVSFKRDETDRFGFSNRPYDFFVKLADDVCEIITKISHLKPIITFCPEEILSPKDVLERFEIQEVCDIV